MKKPEKIIYKYKEYQDLILRLIEEKENINNSLIKIKNENDLNLRNLKQTHESLLKEYNLLNENYHSESMKCKQSEKKIDIRNMKYYDLLKDLYLYIINIFNRKNNNINLNVVLDVVTDLNKFVNEIESLIGGYLFNLNSYEKNDKQLFGKIVNNRKEEVKIYKQNLVLQKLIKNRIDIKKKVEINKNKFTFIFRKTEAPYRLSKKIKKIINEDENNQELENNELINY